MLVSSVPADPRGSRYLRVLPLVPILLLAAGVRLLGLGNQDLWGDEAFSVTTAIGPIGNLIGALSTGEPHPPLYPLLLAAWLRLLGHSELVSRLPSAFEGILSVAVAAAIARSFAPEGDDRAASRASVLGGLLVAVNPFQVWYAQEARMYAQVSLFGGLSALLLLRMWRGARGSVIPYALAVVGVAGSHYFGLFVPLGQGIVVALHAREKRSLLKAWLSAVIFAAVLYLPWVYLARDIFLHYYGAPPGAVDLPAIAVSALVRVAAGWSVSWRIGVVVAVFLSALALIGVAARARSDADRFTRALLVSWLVTPFVAGYLVSLVRPMYAERYLIVSSLPFILLVARAIASRLGTPWPGLDWLTIRPDSDLGSRGPVEKVPAQSMRKLGIALGGIALVGVLVVALGPLYNVWIGRYVKSTYNTHVRDVASLMRPDDVVILDGTSQRPLFSYYAPQSWAMYPLPDDVPLDPNRTAAELTQFAQTHAGAWIFLYATTDYDPGYFVARWLSQHAYRAFDDWAVSGRLQYYRFASDAAMTTRPTNLVFGDLLRLTRYAWTADDFAVGDSIPIAFWWDRLGPTTATTRVSLRLVDQSSFTWAQTDQDVGGDFAQTGDWPSGQTLDDHHALLVPPGTPPGDYRLLLTVYRADGSQTEPASGSGATIESNGVLLTTIHVTKPSDHIWAAGLGGFHGSTAMFNGLLGLVGFAGSDSVTAGESGYLTLVWKSLVDHPMWTDLRLEVVDGRGKVVEQRDLPLAPASFPTTVWKKGDVIRQQYNLPISDQLAPGTYRLEIAPGGPAIGASTTIAPTVLGSIIVRAGPLPPPVVTPGHPLSYSLGSAVELAGYDLSPTRAQAGQPIQVTLHWLDRAALPIDYTGFVHVLDASGMVVAQRDQQPAGGHRPTSSWFPGNVIVDAYQVDLSAKLLPGRYEIEVGMYNSDDGARLPVTHAGQAAGDHIIIAQLEIAL